MQPILHSIYLSSFFFFLMIRRPPRSTLFPTRRSSDLEFAHARAHGARFCAILRDGHAAGNAQNRDRKSTRLNSSHVEISYAVFCWKKKNIDALDSENPDGASLAAFDGVGDRGFADFFFFECYGHHRDLHSFPTRRSSDLLGIGGIVRGDRRPPPLGLGEGRVPVE